MKLPTVRNLVNQGKNGGFVNILQNSLDRVFVVSEQPPFPVTYKWASFFDRSNISYLAFDVSSAGEALYLIRRMKQQDRAFFQTYRQLVVDIGANDGLMSSNSFNFIQLGWEAILVEPQSSLLNMAKQNIKRYANPYNEKSWSKVTLVNAVLSNHDGIEDFTVMAEDRESKILDHGGSAEKNIIRVPSMTVQTFTQKYHVPKHFAVLFIVAGGIGDKILHQWMDASFQPAYILYEARHNREPATVTSVYLQEKVIAS